MAVTNTEGVILHVNDLFCQISGYSKEELVGQTHSIIKSDEHPPEFYADMWQTINTGQTWCGTFCNKAKDGKIYWVSSTITPLLGDNGKPRLFMAMRTNITALKETQDRLHDQVELLKKTQEQLATFYNHAPIGISWREFDTDGVSSINHVNTKFCEIVGLTPEQASDFSNVMSVTHPADRIEQQRLTAELYAGTENQLSMDKRYVRPNGDEIWCNLTIVVLRDKSGRVTHHFGMLADITKRIQAVKILESREARWRTYLNTASEVLYAITPEGDIKFVSSAWTTKLGYTTDSALGRRYADYVHPDDDEAWQRFFATTLAQGASPVSIEHRVRHADGRWIWHAMSASIYSDRNSRTAFLGVGRDITLRLEAQNQLQAALARREEMERIVNRSPSVVVLWKAEENWPVEFVSQSMRQFGYEPEYFIDSKRGFLSITHPEDCNRINAEVDAHAQVSHDEYNQEYRILCADGSVRWIDDHTVVRRDAEGVVTHHEGLITDITPRKEAEERERELRERDLRTAGEIQAHLRPREFPDFSEIEVEAFSDPSMLIGGDYYDILKVDERHWGFVIADVSGKGAGAALVMTECRAMMRLCSENELSPAAVLRRVNSRLQPDMRPGMFVAAFYGIINLDTRIMRFCRAGHEPPLILHTDGKVDQLPGSGLAVGLDEGPLFDEMLEECEIQLKHGDLIALYTDGITEASSPTGEEFGRDRLASGLQRNSERPLTEVIKTIDRYVRNFCVLTPRHDDRTLLLIRAR
jgi:sigma-B regulation protein RsbU (phosphoserine phosphatase)